MSGAEPELADQRQQFAKFERIVPLEDRHAVLDPKAFFQHRPGQSHMLDAEGERLAQGGGGGKRIAEHAEIRQPLALAGKQADAGMCRQPLHIAEKQDLLLLRHARRRIVQRRQFDACIRNQRRARNAVRGHFLEQAANAQHAVCGAVRRAAVGAANADIVGASGRRFRSDRPHNPLLRRL